MPPCGRPCACSTRGTAAGRRNSCGGCCGAAGGSTIVSIGAFNSLISSAVQAGGSSALTVRNVWSSTNTVSCHTFAPPAQGGLPGKFAPPATSNAPLCAPTNGPATPSFTQATATDACDTSVTLTFALVVSTIGESPVTVTVCATNIAVTSLNESGPGWTSTMSGVGFQGSFGLTSYSIYL